MGIDWVHVHLALVHVPVVGIGVVSVVLLVGVLARSGDVLRVGFGLAFALALVTGLVYLTGEPTEERLEDRPGFSESRMEAHEEAALPATVVTAVAGLAALAGLIRNRRGRVPARWSLPVLALTLVAALALARVANLGGSIRHAEIGGASEVQTEHVDD